MSEFIFVNNFCKKTKQTMVGIDASTSLLAEKNITLMIMWWQNMDYYWNRYYFKSWIFNDKYISTYVEDGYYSNFTAFGNAITQTLEGT